MTPIYRLRAPVHRPTTPHAAALMLAVLLALSACGGGKTTAAEPNMVPPGAPRAADIPSAASAQAAASSPVATAPTAPASTPASAPASTTTASASLKSQIQALERSGALPALDRSTSITGPDANNNGVRDDIEAYIAGLPLSDAQKRAALQDARATQAALVVDLADKAALQKVGDGLMASTNCLGDLFVSDIKYASELSGKIEAMTANTKERARRYIQYNSARSGSVTSMPEGDSCEK